MPKYRKIPVVIDAVEFVDHTSLGAICDFMGVDGLNMLPLTHIDDPIKFYMRTPENEEGEQVATQGDWIIKGVAGEFYPCKPDIFKQTYEEA